MREHNLNARAQHIGTVVLGRLGALMEELGDSSIVGDLRGRGAMLAVEIVKPGTANTTKEPDADATKAIAAACLAAGVVILTCGTYGNVVRLLPPLVISDELLTDGLDVLVDAIRAAGGAQR
jgi:4-aminobutyrate aminotransferase/(S)-3-amino-2-methylpropionate transaminase